MTRLTMFPPLLSYPSFYMIPSLALVHSEVIGLYGLIVALILNTRVGEASCAY